MAYMRRFSVEKVAREDRHRVMRERLGKVRRISVTDRVVHDELAVEFEECFSAGSDFSEGSRYHNIDGP